MDRPLVEKAAASGLRKMSLLQNDPGRYMLRSVLAGMYLSIVVFLFWMLMQNLGASPFGKVIASAFFGVGLSIIVFTNAELFTSNVMYLAISSSEGRTSWLRTVNLWLACFVGNLLGAAIVAGLLYGADLFGNLPLDHALHVGAEHKVHQTATVIFFKGVLANWIVCLAVRLALSCKEDMAKITMLVSVVFIFLYLGFEHSVANMGTFMFSLLGNGSISLAGAAYNLTFCALGNVVGGALFVGLPFAYINPSDPLGEE